MWRPDSARPELQELLQHEPLARYFEGWGRAGDMAIIAAHEGEPIGAGWFRTFSESEPGYGFVSSEVPELGIAVAPHARGCGAGTAILRELQDAARANGYEGLSLSVHPESPALRLYRRAGFTPVSETATSITMLWRTR